MNRSFGCGFSASHVAAEIVTEPNGEPPVGGSKIPFTVNVRVLPVTNVTGNVDPTVRWWSSAYPLSTNAPFSPSVVKTSWEPSFHTSVTTSFVCGVTAVE